MRVRFNDKMMADLLTHKRGDARTWLLALNTVGMQVQGEPRPGRINVRFRLSDSAPWSYRTYARRDLVEVTA
jgi:hypothetical protein